MIRGYRLVNIRPVAALYGGSFDPPHQGHQQIVEHLISLPFIDTVIVTPAWLNPFKKHSLASPQQRLAWCRSLFRHPKVIVDPGEVEAGHPVYTADTVARLNREYDVRYVVIGSDNLSAIETWYDFEQLNQTVTWLVFERKGYETGYEKLKNFRRFPLNIPISSHNIRTEKSVKYIDPNIAHDVQKMLNEGTHMTLQNRIHTIVNILDEKKADQIEIFDLADTDYIAKAVVLANSLGGKHTVALLDHLKKDLKPLGETFLHTDETEDWVVADLGDIIIHIMTPEYRQRYSLEEFLTELKRGELK